MKTECEEILLEIDALGKSALNVIKESLARNNNMFYSDILLFGVINRTLKLSRGFRVLIESSNYECSIIVLRGQIDTMMRFYGGILFDGSLDEYVKNFLNADVKLSKLISVDGEKMNDKYLIGKLNQIYPGIENVYKQSCRYVHLTEIQLQNSFNLFEISNIQEDIQFGSHISSEDPHYLGFKYLDLINCFLEVTKAICGEINSFVDSRNSMPIVS